MVKIPKFFEATFKICLSLHNIHVKTVNSHSSSSIVFLINKKHHFICIRVCLKFSWRPQQGMQKSNIFLTSKVLTSEYFELIRSRKRPFFWLRKIKVRNINFKFCGLRIFVVRKYFDFQSWSKWINRNAEA